MVARLSLIPLLVACRGADPPRTPSTGTLAGTPTGSSTGTSSGTPAGTTSGTTSTGWSLPEPSWEVTGDWSAVSSPRLVDLTGDGVLDVVNGHGTESGSDPLVTLGKVTAWDGATGAPLWEVGARQDLFASAALVELGGDPTPDLVIGGRHAELMAVDGSSGDPLWSWPDDAATARQAGWYNFYTAALPGDVDLDGVDDLLVANGGDSLLGPLEVRPPGRLALLSGVDGSVLADAPTPDGAETYLSPVVHGDGFLFGTGGETWPGGLWRASLSDLLAEDLSPATLWIDASPKGAIAPPALADLDGDGIEDAIASTFSGSLVAIDGATGAELWRHDLPDHETHAMPALAELTGDGVPDVFASFSEGTLPLYTGLTLLAIDGATGAEIWRGTEGVFTSSGPVAADLDGDGLDEVIVGLNDENPASPMHWRLWLFDPVELELVPWSDPFDRGGVASPWIGDLDGDGSLELVTTTTDLSYGATWRIARYDLEAPAPSRVAWGAYMGTDHDSRYR